MKRSVLIMEEDQSITKKALEYWEKKANCARTTVCSVLSHYGNEPLCEPFYKAMLPMGGGFGEGLVCGAVVGSLGGISLILAEKGLSEKAIARGINLWKSHFKEKFGSLNCFDLIAEFKNAEGKIDFKIPGRREKCTDFVTSSVTSAKQIIDSTIER